MEYLSVQIVRFVDEYQPGIVACDFLDAAGHCNTIIAKIPLVSMKDLDAGSTYPRPGGVGYEVIARWRDTDNRELVRVSTHQPWGLSP